MVSPAGDVWSLGMTLIEVLTGRRPAAGADARPPGDLPEPFATIVRHALERDARGRWTIPQISKYLTNPGSATAALAEPVRRKRIAPLGVWILLGAILVVVAGVLIRQSDTSAPPAAAPSSVAKAPDAAPPTQQAQPEPAKPAMAAKKEEPKPKAEPVAEAPKPEAQKPVSDATPAGDGAGVPGQPMPDVTGQARGTIRGRVKVSIRLDVNPAGAVTDAKIEGPGGGRYFSDLALKTVRQWKFEPVSVNGSETGQRWRVRFEFQKTGTKVQRQRLSP